MNDTGKNINGCMQSVLIIHSWCMRLMFLKCDIMSMPNNIACKDYRRETKVTSVWAIYFKKILQKMIN